MMKKDDNVRDENLEQTTLEIREHLPQEKPPKPQKRPIKIFGKTLFTLSVGSAGLFGLSDFVPSLSSLKPSFLSSTSILTGLTAFLERRGISSVAETIGSLFNLPNRKNSPNPNVEQTLTQQPEQNQDSLEQKSSVSQDFLSDQLYREFEESITPILSNNRLNSQNPDDIKKYVIDPETRKKIIKNIRDFCGTPQNRDFGDRKKAVEEFLAMYKIRIDESEWIKITHPNFNKTPQIENNIIHQTHDTITSQETSSNNIKSTTLDINTPVDPTEQLEQLKKFMNEKMFDMIQPPQSIFEEYTLNTTTKPLVLKNFQEFFRDKDNIDTTTRIKILKDFCNELRIKINQQDEGVIKQFFENSDKQRQSLKSSDAISNRTVEDSTFIGSHDAGGFGTHTTRGDRQQS